MTRRLRTLLLAGLLVVASGAMVITATTSASAATQICDQYGTTTVGGKYVVQNNRWGSSATQCISVTDTGFSIIQQDGTGNLSGAPVSYPSIYLGCHYSNCSPGSPLPAQISKITSAPSSISDTYPASGTYDASYDIWLNATTDVSGVQDTEIMIWLNHTGSINPVGSATGTATIAGHSWTVWTGNNGQNNVVSYVQAGLSSLSFDVKAFISDTLGRGSTYGTTSWYLTSIQAGFEPWIGGVGLSVNTFSASVNTGGNPSPTPTPSPTPSPSPSSGGGACSATYSTTNSWSGGFQGGVTVRAGSNSINGWAVRWTFPSGQTVTQIWSGALTQSGSSETVQNLSYNGQIPSNGTQTFGFLGNGSAPSSLALTCTSP
jgi:hypothetical protein